MNKDIFGYNENIPEKIQDIFMWLSQDLADLYHLWEFYIGFFGNKEDAYLLADHLYASFIVIEQSLRTTMIMSICRLNDPPYQKSNKNLSLKALTDQCNDIDGLEKLYSDFHLACEPFEIYRNKRIGHRDLPTSINYESFLLPGIGKAQVEKVLTLTDEILNKISHFYADGDFYFKSSEYGGADAMLHLIKAGIENSHKLKN